MSQHNSDYYTTAYLLYLDKIKSKPKTGTTAWGTSETEIPETPPGALKKTIMPNTWTGNISNYFSTGI